MAANCRPKERGWTSGRPSQQIKRLHLVSQIPHQRATRESVHGEVVAKSTEPHVPSLPKTVSAVMEPAGWVQLVGAGALGLTAGITIAFVLLKKSAPQQIPRMRSRPHPNWKPGQKLPPSFKHEETIQINPSEHGPSQLYPLTISAIVPRPVAFVSSLSKDGVGNLSPYSYFNTLAHDPPILAVGHCWSKGKPKDSLRNILETEEFVVSIISDWFVEAANHTCGPYSPEHNEFDSSGLTQVPSLLVAPPRVGESAVNMECKLRHTYDVKNSAGEVTCTIVLGEVVMFHIAKAVASKSPHSGKLIVDEKKLRAISRFGGNIYGEVDSFFEIPRPDSEGRYPEHDAFTASARDAIVKRE